MKNFSIEYNNIDNYIFIKFNNNAPVNAKYYEDFIKFTDDNLGELVGINIRLNTINKKLYLISFNSKENDIYIEFPSLSSIIHCIELDNEGIVSLYKNHNFEITGIKVHLDNV